MQNNWFMGGPRGTAKPISVAPLHSVAYILESIFYASLTSRRPASKLTNELLDMEAQVGQFVGHVMQTHCENKKKTKKLKRKKTKLVLNWAALLFASVSKCQFMCSQLREQIHLFTYLVINFCKS